MPKRVFGEEIGTRLVEKHATGAIRTETLGQMSAREPISLKVALRIYPESRKDEKPFRSQKRWRLPKAMLIFDTESRVDATQRLTFGSYRFIVKGRCLEEGLFMADDLPEADQRILQQYVSTHNPALVAEGLQQLPSLTLPQS